MTIKCCKTCKEPERYPGCGDKCDRYQKEKERFKMVSCERQKEDDINQYQRKIISENRCKSLRY